MAKFATAAFLCARAQGRAEAGLASAGPRDSARWAEELVSIEAAQEQLTEIREIAREVLHEAAETLHMPVGEAEAVDLLSQWEGFGRFCRHELGVEPLTLAVTFGLSEGDPVMEVRTTSECVV